MDDRHRAPQPLRDRGGRRHCLPRVPAHAAVSLGAEVGEATADLEGAEALDILIPHLDHIVQVTDAEVSDAMRILFTDTHNVAEGAGAASFAAALLEREMLRGQIVGVTMSGGNVDADVFARVLT